MSQEEIRTVCRMCHGGCGAIVELSDGEVVRVRGDRSNPNNRGFLCAKGLASVEQLRHSDRLRRPLRRVGPRGSGRFEPVSWEEAMAEIAERMRAVRARDGAEAVVFAQGTDRNYQEWLFRFANAFGSPNVLGPAHVCFYPRVMAGILSMGAFTFADYEGTPGCLLVWGSNKVVTHGDGVIGTRLTAALKRGTEMVVVDPRRTWLAKRARQWLQVRPGTDAALALGMLHVVVGEGIYDRGFVEAHTVGFDALVRHLKPYTPEAVERITSVPAEQLRAAARFYAAGAAAIEAGTGIEQNGNSFHTARALYILSAVCGNLDRPGGDVVWEPTRIVGRRAFPETERLPAEQHARRLGGGEHQLLSMAGWAHPDAVWRAILDGEPYPVRAMLVFGSNLLVNYADSERIHRALERLDFLVVSDLYLTPTARMADLVLPVSSWLERDQVVEHAHYVAARRGVARVGECRSDEEILNDLAARLGMGDAFWGSAAEALDYKLAPLGMRWRELTERHYLANELRYFKHRAEGFRTRTGKFNLYCERLRQLGYEPLPVYRPPAGGEEPGTHRYLLTTAHSPFFFNSEFRNLSSLRRREPDPTVELHPESAEREGIADGDWVEVAAHGRGVLFRARVTDAVAPGVLCASPTWWYPELPFEASWRRSNVNLLTRAGGESPEMGSSNLRGIPCTLRKPVPAGACTTRPEEPCPSST
jgi:anaerobic selenocysteine-containing dehydrogenase